MDIFYNSLNYYLIFNITYHGSSLILFLLDYFKLFINYKLQKDRIEIMINSYKKILPVILRNTLVGIIPTFLIVGYYESMYESIFDYWELLINLPLALIMTDIFFYCAHRLLHIPPLYKLFHKKHHEIIAPIGLSAVYMTIIDLYIGNILPVYLPLFILKAHPITFKIWMILTTFNTVIFAHSGFVFLAKFHDYHHSNFSKNYGANIFMDRLFGTYHHGIENKLNVPRERMNNNLKKNIHN